MATTLLTFVVGVVNIGRSFNYDEAVTYSSFINGGSVWRALTTQVVFNNHQTFSAIQAVLWRVGLTGETPQRLAPVLCGAATVGLLTWWLSRYVSVIAGVAAGLTLLLNPVFLVEFRLLRGYALATFAVLVAVICTHRSWHDHRRRWLVLGAVAMTVAVTAHAYSALAFLMLAIVALALRRVRIEHVVAWSVAAIAAFVIQLPLLDDALRQSEARGSVYRPWFARVTGQVYLGDRTTVIILLSLFALIGFVTLVQRSRRHAAALAGASVLFGSVVLVLWQVVQPRDLYPRFFVTLTPYLAALIGVGVARIPYRLGLVPFGVAIVLLIPNAREVLDTDPSLRRAAAVIEAGRQLGFEVCGTYTEGIEVYAPAVRSIDASDPDAFGDCELYVAVLGIGDAGTDNATQRFDHRVRAGSGVVIYTSDEFEPTVVELTRR